MAPPIDREYNLRYLRGGAVVEVTSAEDLAREVLSLLTDEGRRRGVGERARSLVDRNRGALESTVDALAGLLA